MFKLAKLKTYKSKLKTHPKYDAVLNWGKLISITGLSQIIVQGVGFVSGILIIRLLPVKEYAFYTLANTMLGMMTVLADGGISTGVLAEGGKVWEDKKKLGAVLATGLNLRKKFAIVSLLISIPILFYLLLDNDASYVTAILITLSVIPAFYAALSDSLLQIVPKLHQSIYPLQQNQIKVGIGRLLLTALTLFLFPWAFIGVLSSGLPRVWGNFKLRKIASVFVDEKQGVSQEVQSRILNLVKKIMPTSIYYCISGQITIWLVSFFGDTSSIAQLGALSRLSMLLTLFSVIINTVLVPRFSKIGVDKKLLLKRLAQISGVVFILMLPIIALVYYFPEPVLWLLGDVYKGLEYELFLSVSVSCIALISGVLFSLFSSRGWAIPPVILISINIISIIILASVLELSSLVNALYFNLGVNTVALLQTSFFILYKINKLKS